MSNRDLYETIKTSETLEFHVEAAAADGYTVDVPVHRNQVLAILRGLIDNGYGDRSALWDLMAGESATFLFRP